MADPYISEVKYLGNSDRSFVEVAVPAGSDVSDILITIYYPDGTVRSVCMLETHYSTNAGKDVYLISTDTSSSFGGLSRAGAVSLSQGDEVLQFVSFGQAKPVVAKKGIAKGLESEQIGSASPRESLETDDGGKSYYVQTEPNGGTIPCFVKGTRIATPSGWVEIQDLKPGRRSARCFWHDAETVPGDCAQCRGRRRHW